MFPIVPKASPGKLCAAAIDTVAPAPPVLPRPDKLSSTTRDGLSKFGSLPDAAYIRIGALSLLLARSPASIWRHVREGRLPKPIKLSPRITAWRVGDLRKLPELGGTNG